MKIDELKFDDKNFNKHTEFGMGLLEKSLRENGAGRSILIDKDNNIIAGNGIIEAAGSVGLENIKVVEISNDISSPHPKSNNCNFLFFHTFSLFPF